MLAVCSAFDLYAWEPLPFGAADGPQASTTACAANWAKEVQIFGHLPRRLVAGYAWAQQLAIEELWLLFLMTGALVYHR